MHQAYASSLRAGVHLFVEAVDERFYGAFSANAIEERRFGWQGSAPRKNGAFVVNPCITLAQGSTGEGKGSTGLAIRRDRSFEHVALL